ncbi:MAG: hypothetical protein ACI4T5_10530 [Prevotella sp.]
MFYVTGTKVYLATLDEKTKVYPEVRLVKTEGGAIVPEVLSTGVSKKPPHREICTLAEIIARFGQSATTAKEDKEPKKTEK